MALSNSVSPPVTIGDRSTSDVIVRIRAQDNHDDWIYCHSHILTKNSKYFADRLSDNWPTCQILDSRNCVDVYCEEFYFDHHVTILRLFYTPSDEIVNNICNVKNALGILQVSVKLGCPDIVTACVRYLEAVPWEESEEEEILKIVPSMGSQAEPILARLKPVDPMSVINVFISAIRFATSSSCSSLNDIKTSAQEQLEYMLTEDDDASLLTPDDRVKSEVRQCIHELLSRFVNLVRSLIDDLHESKIKSFYTYLTDISWASHIVTKLEISIDFVKTWVEASVDILKVAELLSSDNSANRKMLKVVQVTSRVLEAIALGHVILPATKRHHMVVIWLPFVRSMGAMDVEIEEDLEMKIDHDMWQSLESSFVSIILTLPLSDQALILTEWLENQQDRYPDLTEAFEVWCYRSKVAKRRLALADDESIDKL